MRLGLVARCDNTGLGNQSLELAQMLDPSSIFIINSITFQRFNRQYPERYKKYKTTVSQGMLTNRQVMHFINYVDVALSCETFYNNDFVDIARGKGKKTILQYNFEFLDNLSDKKRSLPDILLAPSMWRIDEVKERFGKDSIVEYLPPPTNIEQFDSNKKINMKRHNRLLHIAGKTTYMDRNGTDTVFEMLKYSKANYELVIKSQSPIDIKYQDKRLRIETGDIKSHYQMYENFDALLLPRRYAGLCLPMNEALASGIPVFMTNISPNNFILPPNWLANSSKIDEFMARTNIEVYEADAKHLAETIDNYFNEDNMLSQKELAFDIAYNQFSPKILKDKYLNIINKL